MIKIEKCYSYIYEREMVRERSPVKSKHKKPRQTEMNPPKTQPSPKQPKVPFCRRQVECLLL